jgi:hypothetical protein
VAKYPFLSDEWLAEVHRIVAEHDPDVPAHASVTLNLVVTDTPFGEDRLVHMGAKDGKGDFGPGHVENADVTFTTDYATAREIFVSGNPQAGMQAFLEGKVKMQGDMTKLLAAQAGGVGPGSPSLAAALQDVTE